MTSGPPPEEPQYTSEHALLSPASPKPIHFPSPASIPVLEMQTDVAFNQTDLHMSDPSMRNTDVRHDAWRDPNAQQPEAAEDQPSPYSTGGDAAEQSAQDSNTQDNVPVSADTSADMQAVLDTADAAEPAQASNDVSHETNAQLNADGALAQSNTNPSPESEVNVSINEPTAQPSQPQAHSHTNPDEIKLEEAAKPQAGGDNVDYQALLDSITANAPANAAISNGGGALNAAAGAQPLPPGVLSPTLASSLGAPPSGIGLPPRPPPQEQPLIHPNYTHSKHIRDYHPHAEHPAFQPQTKSNQPHVANIAIGKDFVPPVHTPTTPSQPPSQASPVTSYSQQWGQENRRESQASRGDGERPWTPDTNRQYENFLNVERNYVSEGRWEQFPTGSRLFVGNLSSEKVTKRDIFHVFHTYGELAQISIKQAYGFVQFLRTDDCARALSNEQGRVIRDKKIHLEISKPQKNRQQNNQNNQRRSRSPDYNRGGNQAPAGVDRYVSGGRNAGNQRNQRNGRGGRDEYRRRSPSPRGYGRDRYDDNYGRRSRSPSYGNRMRAQSPPRDAGDDLPLPRRAPGDVPDVQIIVLDTLDRDFISWVEKAFSSRNVRVDVLLLSPRLSEEAVVRRQIVEGVQAVVKLTRVNQETAKIPLQVFDRRGGVNNVKFEEYANLDPSICVELVLRAKQTHAAPPAPQYGYSGQQQGMQYGYGATQSTYQPPPPSYGAPPNPQQPPPGAPPNISNLITNLDPSGLQSLLTAMNQPPATPQAGQPYGQPQPPVNLTPELARLLQTQQQQQYGQPPQQDPYAALRNNPALAGFLNGQQQQQQQQQQPLQGAQQAGQSQPDMQEILARLGTYNSSRR